jgi:hypothetical protein
MTATRQTRQVTRPEFERVLYIRRNYDLSHTDWDALNNIEAGYFNSEPVEYCYFDTLRQLLDKYNL